MKEHHRRGLLIAIMLCMVLSCAPCRPADTAPADTATETAAPPFLDAYEYDADLPLNAEVELVREAGTFSVYHVAFDSTSGERVPALLHLPLKSEGPHPCIMIQHGYGGDKSMSEMFAATLAPRGYALFSIDAEYHGERKEPGKDVLGMDAQSNADAWHQSIVDLRRAVDYLASRGDMDMDRLGYIGLSMGSFFGGVLVGVEPRLDTALLIVGGADWHEMFETSQVSPVVAIRDHCGGPGDCLDGYADAMKIVEPADYIARFAPRPLLMINCENDKYVPKATGETLFEAAAKPKYIEWFTCDGDIAHIPPAGELLSLIKKWYKKQFGM